MSTTYACPPELEASFPGWSWETSFNVLHHIETLGFVADDVGTMREYLEECIDDSGDRELVRFLAQCMDVDVTWFDSIWGGQRELPNGIDGHDYISKLVYLKVTLAERYRSM